MQPKPSKSIEQVIRQDGRYQVDAVRFVREGLSRTISSAHPGSVDDPQKRRHVSGAQLCEGLRALAIEHWGLMARQVLRRWSVTCTRDFGEIVFLMVENGWMQKEPDDRIEDFDEVYDFADAFGDALDVSGDI